MLIGYEPDPGSETAPRPEGFRISDTRHQRGRQRRPHTRNGSYSSRRLASLERCQAMISTIELQYPGLQHLQLSSKSRNTFARHIGSRLSA